MLDRRPKTRARPRVIILFLVLVAVVDLATGCGAYYNTFYHAKKRYEEAEKQHEASRLPHPSPQVLALYQQSLEKSRKVIDQWPDSKWVDDARYLIGMAHLGREEFDEARSAFQNLIARHPDSKLVPDAHFGIGLSYLGLQDYTRAEQALRDVLEKYPDFERRDEVLLNLARSAAERRSHREAAAAYGFLLDHTDSKDFEVEALMGRGDALQALGVYDSALAEFEAAERLVSEPEERYEISLERGQCLEELARFPEALAIYQRLEGEYPDATRLPRTQIQTARVLTTMGRYEDALSLYERTLEKYPSSSYAAQAQFQIGILYELYLEDYDKAIEAYGLVRQRGPRSEFVELAENRRTDLQAFGELRQQSVEGEADAQAEAAYQLGEIEYFRFKRPEEAIDAFRRIEVDYPESAYASKAAFAVAWLQEHELADTLAALTAYERVFARYPGTEYGIHAGARIGRVDPDSVPLLVGRIRIREAREDSLKAAAAAASAQAASGAAADTTAGSDVASADSLAGSASFDSTGVRAAQVPVRPDERFDGALPMSAFGSGDSLRDAGEMERMLRARDSLLAARRARQESLQAQRNVIER